MLFLCSKIERNIFVECFVVTVEFNATTAEWHKSNHHVCRINKIPAKQPIRRYLKGEYGLVSNIDICFWCSDNVVRAIRLSMIRIVTLGTMSYACENQSGVFILRTQQIHKICDNEIGTSCLNLTVLMMRKRERERRIGAIDNWWWWCWCWCIVCLCHCRFR